MLHFTMNMPFYLMSFYGSIMIITVLILRALLKNHLPKFVFPVLWSVVLLRLLIPFSLSSPLSMKVPEFSMPYFGNETAVSIVEDVVYTSVPNTAQEAAAGIDSSVIPNNTPAAAENIGGNAISNSIQEAAAGIDSNTVTETPDTEISVVETAVDSSYAIMGSQNPGRIILFVYFAGIVIMAGILSVQRHCYSKRLKSRLLVEHNETINKLLRERNMGHILVFTNDEIASPLVCGLITPKIYLPTRMDFSNTELLRHVLCHETMHIRRKDNWIKAAMLTALCVNWFNPLVWIMSKCLSADLETACDAAVLDLYSDEESKKQYAMSLLTMAITGNRPTLLYSAFSKTEVEKRIEHVLHYKKSPAALLVLSVCLVLSSSVVFATGGQAPFSPYLTAFCASDNCRWGVQASLTRDIALGENPGKRAENVIFRILKEDTANDPEILEAEVKSALSDEFQVEKSAFSIHISLCLDSEEMYQEYAAWGLVRENESSDFMLYQGETIRTYSDEMLGRYQSSATGTVDITIVRNRQGIITDVTALHEGDAEFDRRTEDIRRQQGQYRSSAVFSTAEETAVAEELP